MPHTEYLNSDLLSTPEHILLKTYHITLIYVNDLKKVSYEFTRYRASLNHIASEASFVLHINSKSEHEQALLLMEQLIEYYYKHEPLINLLCISIEKYENTADEFQEFNQRLSEMDSGVSALATLMEHHDLNTTDFKDEIGGKSLVSMILNEKRPLNLGHIRKLAIRFNVPPQIFI